MILQEATDRQELLERLDGRPTLCSFCGVDSGEDSVLAIRTDTDSNDSLDDVGRQKLLDLAPRLMGTSLNRTAELDEALDDLPCEDDYCENETCDFDTLVKMLDEYDRITGRTREAEAIDYAAVCAVMQP